MVILIEVQNVKAYNFLFR